MDRPDISREPESATAPRERGPRPLSVTLALVSFSLFIALRFNHVRTVTTELYNTGQITGFEMLLQLAIVVALIFVTLRLSKADGWARWALIPIAAWQIYDLRWGVSELWYGDIGVPIGADDIALWLAPAVLSLAAAILLFGPGRGWFRR